MYDVSRRPFRLSAEYHSLGMRSIRKAVLFVVAALLVLTGSGWLWVESVARRRWAEMSRGIDELQKEADGLEVLRQPLRDPAEQGDAWKHYSSAVGGVHPLLLKGWRHGFLEGDAKADRKLIDADVTAMAASLEELRRGARCSEALRQPPPPEGKYSEWSPTIELAVLALCDARLKADAGRSAESLDRLLDTAQFARDVEAGRVNQGYTIFLSILGMVLEQLREGLASSSPETGDLRRLEHALDVLDRTFPSEEAAAKGMIAANGAWLQEHDPYGVSTSLGGEIGRTMIRPGWRHAFSMRIFKADAFELWKSGLRLPESEMGDLVYGNRLAWNNAGSWIFGSSLESRAKLRLLRVAVAWRSGAPIPDLQDPFGGTLRVSQTTDALKVWSVGADRKEDGGRGLWSRRPSASVPDIVLELKR